MSVDSDPVDFVFLGRQTAGDAELERDLLDLFVGQCARLLPTLLQERDLAARRDAAHTLRGSASALGANRVSEIAATVEIAAMAGETPSAAPLQRAIAAAEEAIARRRGARAA